MKADSELVRRQNRRIVLQALRQHGSLARIELGRITGLSPASITSISSQLIEDNAIAEIAETPPSSLSHVRRGRPAVKLALKSTATHVLAIKISIDDMEIALANFQGTVVQNTKLRVPTYATSREEFSATVIAEIRKFVASAGLQARQIARIGVAVQGLADSRTGTITWSPVFKERDIPIVRPIEEAFGIACIISNDANMIAEGLAAADRQRYGGITAALFTGYGVGMGIIIDGEVYQGATGAAAEFGHMNHIPYGALCRCGRHGCVEAYAADYGIIRACGLDDAAEWPSASAVPPEMMAELAARARNGDALVRAAFEKAGEALGFGIARIIALLNPDRVVIAGPGMSAGEFIEPALRSGVIEGVVDELRRGVAIEYTAFDTDMILHGTIAKLLATVDRDIFAAGPLVHANINIVAAT